MADRAWKRRERQVARALNGRRIPVTGIGRATADVQTPLFAVQVKHGRRRPSYLQDWLAGICGTAAAAQVGIVVWCGNGERLEEAVVMMRMRDFVDLHGTLPPQQEGTWKQTTSGKERA